MLSTETRKNYDLLGIFLSMLCGIHCLVTPFILISFPSLGRGLSSPWFHAVLITCIGLIFYHSIVKSYRLHHSKITLILGVIGQIFIFNVYLFEIFAEPHIAQSPHTHSHKNEFFLLALALLAALLLVVSHFLNIRHCKCLK